MMQLFVQTFAALGSGMLFGFGLSLSGMLDPARVRGFLDITGNWDPGLAFVLGGAVTVAALGVILSKRMQRPLLAASFSVPEVTQIDFKLIAGSVLFGIGWGLVGLCPGPAVALLSMPTPITIVFVVAMLVGMTVHDRFVSNPAAKPVMGGTVN